MRPAGYLAETAESGAAPLIPGRNLINFRVVFANIIRYNAGALREFAESLFICLKHTPDVNANAGCLRVPFAVWRRLNP